MIDIHVSIGASNGDGRREVVYRNGDKRYSDVLDIASGFQREKSIKRALPVLGLSTDHVSLLDAELAQLAAAKDRAGEDNHVGKLVSRTMDTIAPKKLEWLWRDRIPVGKYTEIIGNPGVGKSILTIDLIARITRGAKSPDGEHCMGPGGVVLMSAEDDPADTIRPRLDAAGADVSRVRLVEAVGWFDAEKKQRTTKSICLDRDVPAIEEAIQQMKSCLAVFIDPMTAYCGNVDSHKAAEVRALLVPVTELAQKYNVAMVGVTHFNKNTKGPAIGRGMGSLAWVAAARMAWGVVKDAEDPTVRLMLPIKCNLAADVTGLSYKIIDQDGVPVVAWSTEKVVKTVDEVLAAATDSTPKRRGVLSWLQSLLGNGRRPASEVWEHAERDGFGKRLVEWAKKELRIAPYAEGFGTDCTWYWELPEPPEKHF